MVLIQSTLQPTNIPLQESEPGDMTGKQKLMCATRSMSLQLHPDAYARHQCTTVKKQGYVLHTCTLAKEAHFPDPATCSHESITTVTVYLQNEGIPPQNAGVWPRKGR